MDSPLVVLLSSWCVLPPGSRSRFLVLPLPGLPRSSLLLHPWGTSPCGPWEAGHFDGHLVSPRCLLAQHHPPPAPPGQPAHTAGVQLLQRQPMPVREWDLVLESRVQAPPVGRMGSRQAFSGLRLCPGWQRSREIPQRPPRPHTTLHGLLSIAVMASPKASTGRWPLHFIPFLLSYSKFCEATSGLAPDNGLCSVARLQCPPLTSASP